MSYFGLHEGPFDGNQLPNTHTFKVNTGEYRSGQGEAAGQSEDNFGSTEQYTGKGRAADLGPLLGVVTPPEPETKTRVAILEEAAQLLTGDREDDYGTPQVNFERVAGLLNIIWARKLDEPLSPADVALGLTMLKAARAANGYKRDTAVDLAGYAALWAELNETEDAPE